MTKVFNKSADNSYVIGLLIRLFEFNLVDPPFAPQGGALAHYSPGGLSFARGIWCISSL